MFKIELGSKVESRSTGFTGVVHSRSENLYGCNRYFVQPRVGEDMKLVDGAWFDEEDIQFIEQTVVRTPSNNGGPISNIR